MKRTTSRRDFLKATASTGCGFWLLAGGSSKASVSANERVAFAGIGVKGKGFSDIGNAAKFGDIVAVCDVDKNRLNEALKLYPKAKGFLDYREMFDQMEKSIDAATISTPDHMHAPITLAAMRLKKHCYTQKPLTRTAYEAKRLKEVAAETGVCTQMGNQGSADNNLRRQATQIKNGAIGDVTEIHFWHEFPCWNQAPNRPYTIAEYTERVRKDNPDQADGLIAAMSNRITAELAGCDWNLWTGCAKEREYFPDTYHPFHWRGTWDFGSGALGDQACHAMNIQFTAIDLSNLASVRATTSGHDFVSFPRSTTIVYDFPATPRRPGIKLTWYDGGARPKDELFQSWGIENAPKSGSLIVGTKGALYNGRFLRCEPAAVEFRRAAEHPEFKDVDSMNMYELVLAIRENKPELCWSGFTNLAGPMAETMLVGNLAVWAAAKPDVPGETIEWDTEQFKIKNLAALETPGLENLLKPTYRKGFGEL